MRIWLIATLMLSDPVAAEMYKCVVNDKTLLTDQPCAQLSNGNDSEPELTAAEIQAAFEQEIADKKAAEYQRTLDELAAQKLREQHAEAIRLARINAPQRATQGAIDLRQAMRDPDSFKLETARIITTTGSVCYSYRSKNGFGGYVPGLAILLVTEYQVRISNDTREFNRLWESECSQQRGTDMSAAIRQFAF